MTKAQDSPVTRETEITYGPGGPLIIVTAKGRELSFRLKGDRREYPLRYDVAMAVAKSNGSGGVAGVPK